MTSRENTPVLFTLRHWKTMSRFELAQKMGLVIFSVIAIIAVSTTEDVDMAPAKQAAQGLGGFHEKHRLHAEHQIHVARRAIPEAADADIMSDAAVAEEEVETFNSAAGNVGVNTIGEDFLQGNAKRNQPSVDVSKVSTMIVRHGQIELETNRTRNNEVVAKSVIQIATNMGGYVESNRMQTLKQEPYNNSNCGQSRHDTCLSVYLIIKVPVETFDNFTDAVLGLVGTDEIKLSTFSSRDVTAEYIDTAARAASLNATHQQLLSLMKRANQVDDVLKVQRELKHVSSELERKLTMMKFLKRDSTFSSINVDLRPKSFYRSYQPPPPPPPPPSWSPVRTAGNAIDKLGKVMMRMVDITIYVIIFSIPIGLLLALLVKIFGSQIRKAADSCIPRKN